MFKFFKKKSFWFIFSLILSLPAVFFLLKPGVYWNMHDDMQMIRQLEIEKCLYDGQIPCRWTPDLGYGYGYPLFNFYPPMPYIVGQVYRTLGFSFVNSVKATATTQILLSSVFMFVLATSIFGPVGGFIASLFYTYAPYHALNVYVRGAMNEAWAGVFFPLVFYFSRKLVLEKKIKHLFGLSVSFAGILLSHNPMALTFTPILFLWVLFWFLRDFFWPVKKIKFYKFLKQQIGLIIKLAISGVFAISLTAFYTLPVLFETKYVQIDSMFTGYYHFSVHFAGLFQLFISNFWGDGASVWGPNDDMSFMIGYLHWIIPTILFGIIITTILKNRHKLRKIDSKYWLILLIILLGFGTVFMTHNKSTFIWLLFPIIQKVQFPWRFLNHTAFLFSLSSAGIVLFLNKLKFYKKEIISILLVIFLLFLNLQYFYPIHSGPITDEQKFSGKAWVNEVTSGIYDYLPKTARIAAQGPAKEYVDEISPNTVTSIISDEQKGSNWSYFNLNLSNDSKVTLAQLAFPKFLVTDNGNQIDYQIEPELGRIVIALSAGDHQIFVKFINTPIRTISNYISLIAWCGLAIYLSKPLWQKLIFKK
jgi:hypothetical protein